MQTKIARNPRLDSIDREKFAAMLASDSWAIFRARVVAELERSRVICERADTVLELRRTQGAIAVLRTVLQLPERLMQEMESKEMK